MTSPIPCGADRRWYDQLAEAGIPADPVTIRHAAEALPRLWKQYRELEAVVRDFLATAKSAPDGDDGVLAEMPTFIARRFVAQVDVADESTIDELAVAVRIASALADRIGVPS